MTTPNDYVNVWTPQTGSWDRITPKRYYKWLTIPQPYAQSMASSTAFLKDSKPGGVCRLLKLSSNELQSVLALLPIRQLILAMGTCKRIKMEITHHNSLVTRQFKDDATTRPLKGDMVDDDNIAHLIQCNLMSIHPSSQWVASSYLRKYLPVCLEMTHIEMTRGFDCGFNQAQQFANIVALKSMIPPPSPNYGLNPYHPNWQSPQRCLEFLSLIGPKNLIKFTSFECWYTWTQNEVLKTLFTLAPNLTSLSLDLCHLPNTVEVDEDYLSGSSFSSAVNLSRLVLILPTTFIFSRLTGLSSIPHLTDCTFWFSEYRNKYAPFFSSYSQQLVPSFDVLTSFDSLPTILGLGRLRSIQFHLQNIAHKHIDQMQLVRFFSQLPHLITCQTDQAQMKAFWELLRSQVQRE